MRRVIFALFPGCEILDVAGPVQALGEVNAHGAQYDVLYCALTPTVTTAQGLDMSGLHPLPSVTAADWVFVPGYTLHVTQPPVALVDWLRQAARSGAQLFSVCTGAFVLGMAGLLDGRACTTHWKRVHELRTTFPRARVIDDRLYVEDGAIMTSAGIASGIDMTIHLIDKDLGSSMAAMVAREMVVYMRRDGSQSQTSVYLDYQDHLNASIHEVQQYLIHAPTSPATLDDLAALAHMSPRHLSRTFRRVTGISIGEYRLRLRLEHARTLMRKSPLKMEDIAAQCGFSDARQLRRLWAKHFGSSPSLFRQQG